MVSSRDTHGSGDNTEIWSLLSRQIGRLQCEESYWCVSFILATGCMYGCYVDICICISSRYETTPIITLWTGASCSRCQNKATPANQKPGLGGEVSKIADWTNQRRVLLCEVWVLSPGPRRAGYSVRFHTSTLVQSGWYYNAIGGYTLHSRDLTQASTSWGIGIHTMHFYIHTSYKIAYFQ